MNPASRKSENKKGKLFILKMRLLLRLYTTGAKLTIAAGVLDELLHLGVVYEGLPGFRCETGWASREHWLSSETGLSLEGRGLLSLLPRLRRSFFFFFPGVHSSGLVR